jgi:UDP-N-acetylmuramoyl-L-alanyl-D-glutamate--2,6-diaminopimelate ligase
MLITVVGAGGDRDKTKRPEMARLAAAASNKLILTSDNPRTEDPEAIIQDMRHGISAEHFNRVLAVSNRREAIRTAVALAQKGDIILLAGKGHETYQEISGVKHPFDDKKELSEALNERKR